MSDLEFIGKMNPQLFISLRKQEEMRIKEIKERLNKEKLKKNGKLPVETEPDLTYERDVQEDC
jgi:hypothetical protein